MEEINKSNIRQTKCSSCSKSIWVFPPINKNPQNDEMFRALFNRVLSLAAQNIV
jgi:hypothetical protein